VLCCDYLPVAPGLEARPGRGLEVSM